MKLIRVGAAVLNQTPLDWDGNLRPRRGAGLRQQRSGRRDHPGRVSQERVRGGTRGRLSLGPVLRANRLDASCRLPFLLQIHFESRNRFLSCLFDACGQTIEFLRPRNLLHFSARSRISERRREVTQRIDLPEYPFDPHAMTTPVLAIS